MVGIEASERRTDFYFCVCKDFALTMWEVVDSSFCVIFVKDKCFRMERLDGGGWIWVCSEHFGFGVWGG